jgi:C4-dicarboxylate-specific signal transduction histidine kinase
MVRKMGLFDRWRRKKTPEQQPVARLREKIGTESETSAEVHITEGESETISSLLKRHEDLVQRREELQKEREKLTRKLDEGKLDTTEFRKELMARIQEAAQVSENLRETQIELTQLGYRGTLS